MKKILVLFPKEWDRLELARPEYRGRYEFVYAGFDLFRFPQNAQLATFDVFRFLSQLLERFRRERLDGVFSNNEYFGAPIAAVLAEKLGLPGNDPRVVITAQHKFYARRAFERIAPEAAARYAAFPYSVRDRAELPFELPCFVKPVRATYSVLARRIERFDELRRLLAFWPFEEWVIRRLVKPFNDLMRWYTDYRLDAYHLLAEEILPGMQVNMDGYVHDGRVHVLGVVDENMYPGTSAFRSFEYPSRLPAQVQARMTALAEKLLFGMGYRHGFFNLEFSWDPQSGRIAVIELNPRWPRSCPISMNRWTACGPTRCSLRLPRARRRRPPPARRATATPAASRCASSTAGRSPRIPPPSSWRTCTASIRKRA